MFVTTKAGETLGVSGESARFLGQPPPNNGDVIVYLSADGKARFGAIPATSVALAAPPPIGNVTPNTGAFTTLSATGVVTLSANANIIGGSDTGGFGQLLIKASTRAVRFYGGGTGFTIEGVDTSGVTSYQPLAVGGSLVYLNISGATVGVVSSTGLAVTGAISATGQVSGVSFTATTGITNLAANSLFMDEAGGTVGRLAAVGTNTSTLGTGKLTVLTSNASTITDVLTFAGTGVALLGTTTNNNAAAGWVGEYVESVIASGSAVSLTTATTANVTSISLTAGDWDVWGVVYFNQGATTLVTEYDAGISQTSATLTTSSNGALDIQPGTNAAAVLALRTLQPPKLRLSLSGTTTVYLVVQSTFTVSTNAAYGAIRARRRR